MYFVLEKVRIFILLLVRVLILNILFWLQSVSEFTTEHLIKKNVHPPILSPALTFGRRPLISFGPLPYSQIISWFFLLCLPHPCASVVSSV